MLAVAIPTDKPPQRDCAGAVCFVTTVFLINATAESDPLTQGTEMLNKLYLGAASTGL